MSPLTFTTDIFEAEFLRSFEGLQDGKLFFDRGEEGCYGFSLNADFFNIEGMNIRSPSTSCGIISMACLNLPPEIRYKPENMYLAGIIPGPKELQLTELNHYLEPLMDDMSESWEKGIHFSRTAIYPTGHTTHQEMGTSLILFLFGLILSYFVLLQLSHNAKTNLS